MTAYGEAAALGQAALNLGNSRIRVAPQPTLIVTAEPPAAAAVAPLDPQEELRHILQYAQVRNSHLAVGMGPETGAYWERRAEELLTVALRYKSLTMPADGTPFTRDATYNGLVSDALVARALAGAGIDTDALNQTAALLTENGQAAQAGTAMAGAFASRMGRVPITAEGRANSATGQRLQEELSARTGTTVDTRLDAQYIARTDPRVAVDNRFDWDHVLAGEVNRGGGATGYHAEFAAGGSARIAEGAAISVNPNGTYLAPVEVWSSAESTWKPKFASPNFFPADWSRARIEFEVSEAFKLRTANPAGQGTIGVSPSGIDIRFNWDQKNQRTTFYPLGG